MGKFRAELDSGWVVEVEGTGPGGVTLRVERGEGRGEANGPAVALSKSEPTAEERELEAQVVAEQVQRAAGRTPRTIEELEVGPNAHGVVESAAAPGRLPAFSGGASGQYFPVPEPQGAVVFLGGNEAQAIARALLAEAARLA